MKNENLKMNNTKRKSHRLTSTGFSLWRRRRDSNPRTAFNDYTISNRARSTSYATSPYNIFCWRLNSKSLKYYTTNNRKSQVFFYYYRKKNKKAKIPQ